MITAICEPCDGAGVRYCACQWCEEQEPEKCESGTPEFPCTPCLGTGQQSHTVYANVYEVTRHYGGPEEGGWWYNAGSPIGSQLLKNPNELNEESVRADLMSLYGDYAHGDIYSVLGGVELAICFEPSFAQEWPEEKPRYE